MKQKVSLQYKQLSNKKMFFIILEKNYFFLKEYKKIIEYYKKSYLRFFTKKIGKVWREIYTWCI